MDTPAGDRSEGRDRLLPLTSLRFIAAAMVVFGHTRGSFGLSWVAGGEHFKWNLAVPFFFVLSGFILAYAYPQLDAPGLRRFFVARAARLWPTHVLTLALTVVILGTLGQELHLSLGLANLFLVHAWVPYPSSYFSYNAPSWSISTELGLYLLFPLLVRNLRRTWLPKLLVCLLLYVAVRMISDRLGLPDSRPQGPGADRAGMIVHPLASAYLFVSGMAACLAWQWLSPRLHLGVHLGTALELVAVAGAAWTILGTYDLGELLRSGAPGELAWVAWLPDLRVMLTFPALLVVMALRQGWVARALSWPALVAAGEMSFALYLVHVPLIIVIRTTVEYLKNTERWPSVLAEQAICGFYWLSCLVAAWVVWRCFECPARSWVRAWWRRHEQTATGQRWAVAVTGLASAAALVFAGLVLHLR